MKAARHTDLLKGCHFFEPREKLQFWIGIEVHLGRLTDLQAEQVLLLRGHSHLHYGGSTTCLNATPARIWSPF
jgi:hypothetical protein